MYCYNITYLLRKLPFFMKIVLSKLTEKDNSVYYMLLVKLSEKSEILLKKIHRSNC